VREHHHVRGGSNQPRSSAQKRECGKKGNHERRGSFTFDEILLLEKKRNELFF
jgi:hypothetical protein